MCKSQMLMCLRRRDDEIEPEPASGLHPEPADDNSNEAEESKTGVKEGEMQTFIFSATLSKDLQKNLKKRSRPHKHKKGKPASTLGEHPAYIPLGARRLT